MDPGSGERWLFEPFRGGREAGYASGMAHLTAVRVIVLAQVLLTPRVGRVRR